MKAKYNVVVGGMRSNANTALARAELVNLSLKFTKQKPRTMGSFSTN